MYARVLFLLLLAASSALAKSRISSETPLDFAPGSRDGGRAARNARGVYLAAWLDRRSDSADWRNPMAVRGALFTSDVAGAPDFEIGRAATTTRIGIASVGNDFLVAYARVAGYEPAIYTTHFVRVDEHGVSTPVATVLDGAITSITAWRGHYLVAVKDGDNGVRLAILNRNGLVVREGLSIMPALKPAATNASLYTLRDGRLAILWTGRSQSLLHVSLINPFLLFQRDFDGVPVAASIPSLNAEAGFAEGDRVLLVSGPGSSRDTLVTVALDKQGAELHREDYTLPSLKYLKSLTLVVIGDRFFGIADNVVLGVIVPEPAALRFDADGVRVGGFTKLFQYDVPEIAQFTATAPDGATPVVIGSYAYDPTVIVANFLTADETLALTIESARALSISPPAQLDAQVVQCSGVSTVVWTEQSGWGTRVLYRRYGPDGLPLEGPQVVDYVTRYVRAAVACGRTTALVVWTGETFSSRSGIHGLLLPNGGEAVALGRVSTGAHEPRVTFNGTSYVVSTTDRSNDALQFDLWSERGVWAGHRLLTELPQTYRHNLAWNGETFMLIWHGRAGKDKTAVYSQMLDRFLGPIGVAQPLTEPFPSYHTVYSTAVAPSPHGWLVGWTHTSSSQPMGYAAHTVRLGRDGSLLEPGEGLVTEALPSNYELEIGWNGTAYEVLTASSIVTRTPDGTNTTRPAPPGEWFSSSTYGVPRFVVTWRNDPHAQVPVLYGELVP